MATVKIKVNLKNIKRVLKRLKNPKKGLIKASDGAIEVLLSKWNRGKGADSKTFKKLEGTPEYLKKKAGKGIWVNGSMVKGKRKIDMKLQGKLQGAIYTKKKNKREVMIAVRNKEKGKAQGNATKRENFMKLGKERTMRKRAKEIFFKFLTK